MLEVIDLHFDYHDKPLLNEINFSLDKGELLHLQGCNGSGKTTLLKLIAGLLDPRTGEIRYAGSLLRKQEYTKNICYVGHKAGVSQFLTVREHCAYERKQLESMHSDFDSLSLEDRLFRRLVPADLDYVYGGFLSSGQRRRIALSRLLISKAALWLLDEPYVALDREATEDLNNYILQHLEKGGQVILTSHQKLPIHRLSYKEYHL